MYRIKRLVGQLIEPTKGLGSTDYYDAKLLAGMSLVIVLLGSVLQLVVDPIFWSYTRGTEMTLFVDAIGPVVIVGIIMVAGAYVLARTRHFKWSLYIMLLAAFIAMFVALIVQREVAPVNSMLVYLFVPTIMVLVLLRSVWQILVGVLLILVTEFAIVAIPGTVLSLTEVIAFVQPQLLVVAIVIIAGLHRDAVERARLGNLRQSNELLEQVHRMKSEFVFNTSHELRTPVHAIMGYVDLIAANHRVSKEAREKLRKIREKAEYLQNLSQLLLDVGRIEAGKIEVHRAPFDIQKSINMIIDDLGFFKKPGVEFQYMVECSEVVGDEVSITRIIRNLLENAMKFTEVGFIDLSVRMLDKRLVIIVKDSGIGVATNAQQAIFEPFHQVDSSMARRAGGIGLGLAIVKALADMMGGSIALKSEPGEGSTFEVTIPIDNELMLPNKVPMESEAKEQRINSQGIVEAK